MWSVAEGQGTYFAGENGPPMPPRPRPRPPAGRKAFWPGAERESCMKKAPLLGMKAGSESRFFLYSSCSRRLRSPSVSGRPDGGPTAGAASVGSPVSKSSSSASLAPAAMLSPFIMASVSWRAVKAASERAMGGEGGRALTAGAGLALRAPLVLRFGFPAVGAMPLSASLRSLLSLSASASASASASLVAETSLCESSARSVTTDLVSSSSSSRRRRAMLVVLLRAGAMFVLRGAWCGGGLAGRLAGVVWGAVGRLVNVDRRCVPAAEGARDGEARRAEGERAGRVQRLRGAAVVMEQESEGVSRRQMGLR